MSIWAFLSGLIKPVANIIDHALSSESERLKVKTALFEMQHSMAAKMLEYETRLLEAKANIIATEAQGSSWLQRTWRPITMLTFLILIVADTLGLTAFRLAPQAWTLLQIGLGGYVVGRSAEKIVPKISKKIEYYEK